MAAFTKKEPAAYVNKTHTVIAGNFHSAFNLEMLESIVKKGWTMEFICRGICKV